MITKSDYIKAIKRINTQLGRLEAYSAKSGEKITDYAYRLAMRDIKSLFGYKDEHETPRTRFPQAIPKTKTGKPSQQKMSAVLRAIEKFYDLPTSTISGMKEVYEKRAKTFSEKMKLDYDITAKQLKKLFDSGLYQQIRAEYGSATTYRILGQIELQKNELKAQLENADNKIINVEGRYHKRLAKIFKDDPKKLEYYLRGE